MVTPGCDTQKYIYYADAAGKITLAKAQHWQ